MEIDKSKKVQLLKLNGEDYVLVEKNTYDELLDKLEALDTALDITRSRANASKDLLTAMLQEKLSVAQLREIKGAKTIGGRLRLLREMRNLDQRELSDMSGVSQTTISNLENDRVSEPSFASLDALTTSLGVPAGAVYPFIKGVQS